MWRRRMPSSFGTRPGGSFPWQPESMQVVFMKANGRGTRDRTMVIDDRGARRVAVHVVHDLPHLVVESVFGLADGLWGELSRGQHAEAGRAAGARDPRHQKLGRIVSGAATGARTEVWLSDGHRRAKALTNAVVNHWHDGPDTPAGVRARLDGRDAPALRELLRSLDDATIQSAIDGVQWVLRQWTQTPPGALLRLDWPLSGACFARD